MKQAFSHSQRLTSRSEFCGIYEQGKRYVGTKVVAYYRLGRTDKAKLGITISRKWGKATQRNRFKRVVREAYRLLYPRLPQHLELNIHPRSSYESLSRQEVEGELKCLVKKICGKTQYQSTKSSRNN